MSDKPIMPPEKKLISINGEEISSKPKVVPIMPPQSPEEADAERRQAKALHVYNLANAILRHVTECTESPTEAIGVLQMVQVRIAMGLNSDIIATIASGEPPAPRAS